MKKIFSLILMLILLIGCANNNENKTSSNKTNTTIYPSTEPIKQDRKYNISFILNDSSLVSFGSTNAPGSPFIPAFNIYVNNAFGYSGSKTFTININLSEGYDKEYTKVKILYGFIADASAEFGYKNISFEAEEYYSVIYNNDNIVLSVDVSNIDIEIEGLVIKLTYKYNETDKYNSISGYQSVGVKFTE